LKKDYLPFEQKQKKKYKKKETRQKLLLKLK